MSVTVKSYALTIGLVLVIVVAGCTGVGGDDDSESLGDLFDDEALDGEGDGDSNGLFDDGDADEWDVSSPRDSLREIGSYTSTWSWAASEPETGESGSMTFTTAVDLDGERAVTTMTVTDDGEHTEMVQFYADGKQYSRTVGDRDGEPVYWVTDFEFNADMLLFNYGYAYDTSDLQEWSSEGVETYDGVPVQRYVYEGVDPWQTAYQEEGEFQVTQFTFTMLVDEDGIPRYQQYRVDGVDEDGNEAWFEWEYTITDIGTTTVPDPEWLDEATR